MQHIGVGAHERGGKRAVLLAQLAASRTRDDARLAYFLQPVPGWMRLTAEFRHPSWHCEEVPRILRARPGCFFLKGHGAWPGGLPGSGIDVRHTADRQAVSQHDAVTADQELTDAGLVVACAGFDDRHGPVDQVLFFDVAEQHYVVGQMRNGRVRQAGSFEEIMDFEGHHDAHAYEYWKVHREDIDWRVPTRLD
jgi:hypothetical protein